MRELKHASIRYCPHLGHNVVMETRLTENGDCRWECLNKSDCGYNLEGCRNLLLPQNVRTKGKEAEVG